MAENADPTKKTDDQPGDKKTDDAPKYMTAEEYNKAATAREKRLLKDMEALFERKAAEAKKAPALLVEDEEEPEEPEENEPAAAAEPAKQQQPAKQQPSKDAILAKKAMEKAKATERAMKEEREKSLKKEAEMAEREERLQTDSALVAAGVVNKKQAMAVLKAEGRVKKGEDGDYIFSMPREIAGEKFDEDMPLAEGIKEWLTTEDGKLFAPPIGASGSGAGAQGKGDKGGKSLKDMTKAERKRAAGNALMKWALNTK